MTEAYPLAWPPGWPRAQKREDGRHRFKRPSDAGWAKPWTFADARDALFDEVKKLGGRSPVLSSNFPLNRYGVPSEGRRRPADEGIAVYFALNGSPRVMACDRFETAEPNLRSIALAIAAMRQLERHGGGLMMERAFAGFAALPAPESETWRDTLELPVGVAVSSAEIQAAFRRLAASRHPDKPGGSAEAMSALNRARDAALREVG